MSKLILRRNLTPPAPHRAGESAKLLQCYAFGLYYERIVRTASRFHRGPLWDHTDTIDAGYCLDRQDKFPEHREKAPRHGSHPKKHFGQWEYFDRQATLMAVHRSPMVGSVRNLTLRGSAGKPST